MSIAARGDLPIVGSCDPPVAGSGSRLPFEETMSGRSALPMPIHVLQPCPIARFNHVHPGAGCAVSVAVDYDNASVRFMAPVEEPAYTALMKRSGSKKGHNQGIVDHDLQSRRKKVVGEPHEGPPMASITVRGGRGWIPGESAV
jgi:hypothetical protein